MLLFVTCQKTVKILTLKGLRISQERCNIKFLIKYFFLLSGDGNKGAGPLNNTFLHQNTMLYISYLFLNRVYVSKFLILSSES